MSELVTKSIWQILCALLICFRFGQNYGTPIFTDFCKGWNRQTLVAMENKPGEPVFASSTTPLWEKYCICPMKPSMVFTSSIDTGVSPDVGLIFRPSCIASIFSMSELSADVSSKAENRQIRSKWFLVCSITNGFEIQPQSLLDLGLTLEVDKKQIFKPTLELSFAWCEKPLHWKVDDGAYNELNWCSHNKNDQFKLKIVIWIIRSTLKLYCSPGYNIPALKN